MSARDVNLDRVSLDGFVVRRLSATLHPRGGDHPETKESPWWVYLACEQIPRRYRVSARPVRLEANLVSGREVHGDVKIVERRDDAYGTQLILAGLEPLVDDLT